MVDDWTSLGWLSGRGRLDGVTFMKNDLEERTSIFGERIVSFCQELSASAVNGTLINQLIRAGTSIGANYCEADDAESKKDFRHKIGICRKEARETKYWLRLVAQAAPAKRTEANALLLESSELNLIFSAIIRTTDKNMLAAHGPEAKR